ncbi:hypothetical protein [Ureaplasma canigenitalium]|uniref:hypothetical protein n=1 Tax=Ureaplasma canigenitalium TaxID=42092 RepID=UPI0004E24ECB|nr:hypothetical protein [Ureaplasma canigenitalium]
MDTRLTELREKLLKSNVYRFKLIPLFIYLFFFASFIVFLFSMVVVSIYHQSPNVINYLKAYPFIILLAVFTPIFILLLISVILLTIYMDVISFVINKTNYYAPKKPLKNPKPYLFKLTLSLYCFAKKDDLLLQSWKELFTLLVNHHDYRISTKL